MAISYQQQGSTATYVIQAGGFDRAALPQNLARDLLQEFCKTPYAKTTTLAAFLATHPNAAQGGVMNALHRRHIVSWSKIRDFCCAGAQVLTSRETNNLAQQVFQAFGVNAQPAIATQHGQMRATAWTNLAKQMCWVPTNVFIGPSSGNHGTDLDTGAGMALGERQQLLAGTPWQSMIAIDATMDGFIRAASQQAGKQLRSGAIY